MTRRELREHCFKLLFLMDFHPDYEQKEQIERYFEEPEEDDGEGSATDIVHAPAMDVFDGGYVKSKVEAVRAKVPELDEKIDSVAKGWSTNRMSKVDLTIIRLALYEMLYEEDVPEKVAINEAVEIAKKFGGEDSPSFVNGILAKLVNNG